MWSVGALAGLVLVTLYVLFYIARLCQQLLYSPLNSAPDAHWSTKFCGLWIWWQRVLEQEVKAVHNAHLRLGPVVRLAPNELSVNDVNGGLKPIYEGRLPKTDFYQVANSHGEEPMVAIKDEEAHRRRKTLVARPYSKTYMTASLDWHIDRSALVHDLVSGLTSLAQVHEEIELYDVFFAWSVASISTYVFGRGGALNLLHDIPESRRIREAYFSQRIYQFAGAVLPIPKKFFNWMGYFPEIAWIRQMQMQADEQSPRSNHEKAKGSERTTVYDFMKQGLETSTSIGAKVTDRKQVAILYSELQDHVIGGIDTSAAALAACAWLLSLEHNHRWQVQLREAIRYARHTTQHTDLEQLPLLQAIVRETLRLYSPVAGGQPRMTEQNIQLGPSGHEVWAPPGVKVSCQAYSLHRSSIFDDPESFKPERWLESTEEQKLEIHRWFWAFGSGSRRCLGEPLGLSNLYVALAAIYEHFETRVVEGSELVVSQGMIALPIPNKHGDYIRLRVREVGEQG